MFTVLGQEGDGDPMHCAVLADFSRCLHVRKRTHTPPSDLGNRAYGHECTICATIPAPERCGTEIPTKVLVAEDFEEIRSSGNDCKPRMTSLKGPKVPAGR